MRVAIHPAPHSFSGRWIERCQALGIDVRAVDATASDAVAQIAGCDAFMWHWHHHDPKAAQCARALTHALEAAGVLVFPSTATAWHFDDKVAQKYLFEALGAPAAAAEVFYDLATALAWIDQASFPRVFKLRGGAGSVNVRLVPDRAGARRLARQAFGRGFAAMDRINDIRGQLNVARRDRDPKRVVAAARSAGRIVFPSPAERQAGRDRGYLYLQAYLPDAAVDTRVCVIGARAFAFRRPVRPGDFRASGSGQLLADPDAIDRDALAIAFEVAGKMSAQVAAFDFVASPAGPQIIEVSYGFRPHSLDVCPGYWDPSLGWHAGPHRAEDFMVDDLVAALRARKGGA